jgi:hypothetical protein
MPELSGPIVPHFTPTLRINGHLEVLLPNGSYAFLVYTDTCNFQLLVGVMPLGDNEGEIYLTQCFRIS